MNKKIMKKVLPLVLLSPITFGLTSCYTESFVEEQVKGKLIVNFDSSKGSVVVGGIDSYDNLVLGSTVSFEVTPNAGYLLKEILVNGTDITATKNFLIKDIKTDYVVTINFVVDENYNPNPIPEPKPDVDDDPNKPSEELAKKYNCISITKAIEICNFYDENESTEDYFVYGKIVNFTNESLGNMNIDQSNKSLYVYNPSNWNSLETKPSVGSEIVFKGKLKKFNGKAEISKPEIIEFIDPSKLPDPEPDPKPDVDPDKPTEELATKYNCISLTKAIEIANNAGSTGTTEEYYLYGKIKDITNTTYGNMNIIQGNKTIFAYGPTNWNSLTTKPQVNDEVVLKGKLQLFNSTPEIISPLIVEFISSTTPPTPPTPDPEPDVPDVDPDKPTEELATKYNCISLTKAIEICNEVGENSTIEEYYLYGKIKDITNTTYGNMNIIQGNKTIFAYGPTNWNSLTTKPQVNDEVVLKGKLQLFNNKPEIISPLIVEFISSTTPPTPPTPDPEPDVPDVVETIDGVSYAHQSKIKVEKIYNPKYLGGDYTYSKSQQSTFYDSSFVRAETYNDAIARSSANLLSGDYNIPSNIPNYKNIKQPKSQNGVIFYNARARYIYDNPNCLGEPIGYIINDTDGDDSNDDVIFKGGAYISMDDVSAYLFAFNDCPANWSIGKSGSDKTNMVRTWGPYGRVNNSYFSGDTSRYPYEPELTGINNKFRYHEADFGTDGNFDFYTQNDSVNMHKQSPYFESGHINRGTCRFIYTFESANKNRIPIDGERHIFYTWTHYNDFEEYLNYKGGYGEKFGNLVAGNSYNDKNPANPVKQPTSYVLATFNY